MSKDKYKQQIDEMDEARGIKEQIDKEDKGKLSDLQKLICKTYGVTEDKWSSLYDEADAYNNDPQYSGDFELKPMSIPAMLKMFNNNINVLTVLIVNESTGRKHYEWNKDGKEWHSTAKLFIPKWIDFILTKTTETCHLVFNFQTPIDEYIRQNRVETFSECPDGIQYQPEHGTWRYLASGEMLNTFKNDLLVLLKSWGIRDDKTLNDAVKRTNKLFLPQTLNQKVKRPSELTTKRKMVAFDNGTYDFSDGKWKANNPNYYLFHTHSYCVTNGGAENTDRLLKDMVGDADKFLKEFIGYIFYPAHDVFQDFVFWSGEGGEGKTTLLNFLAHDVVGDDNTSHVSPQDTDKNEDKYATAELFNKEFNSVADISAKPLNDISTIKGLVGGDPIQVRKIYGSPFTMISTAKNIWSANKLPPLATDDISRAIKDRVNVINFINGDTRTDHPEFWQEHDMEKVRTERSQFVWECLQLFQAVLMRHEKGLGRNSWSRPKSVIEDSNTWVETNDPVEQWLESVKEENPSLFEGGYFIKNDAYIDYTIWCSEEGRYAIKKAKLQDALLSRFGFEYKREHIGNSQPYCWVNKTLAKKWNDEGIDWTIQSRTENNVAKRRIG